MATWLIKGKAKKTELFYFSFLRKKVKKNCQKLLQNGCFCKKNIFSSSFSYSFPNWFFKMSWVFFCCIKCSFWGIQIQYSTSFPILSPKASEEVAMLTWSTIEWVKACKAFGGASYEGSLDKPWMLSRSKNIKMFQ